MKGKVISFINMKGGVGKTTLCKEIGYTFFRNKNKKILFIDTDPQSNLTQSLFLKYEIKDENEIMTGKNDQYKTTNKSIQKLFNESNIEAVTKEDIIEVLEMNDDAELSIIPGTLSAVFLNRSNDASAMESAIHNFIDTYKLEEVYDFIFIDCPPTYSLYTIAAILPSDYYIIPVKPDAYSVLGIEMLEKVIGRIKSTNSIYFKNRTIKNLGIIFSSIENGKEELAEMVRETQKLNKKTFFKEYFKHSNKYPNKFEYFIYDYNDKKLKENIDNIILEIEQGVN
ncbi:ParA family protein [Mammaliicoccus vitulinus]|uniref:ParA family protein n=1 Tax=Mammaliicoccus vitulinus TaxID=71237 RepID=UPI0019527B58|nr:ParA family protein [Mammaliicoccus vitulinus]MBM6628541.1 ParA family protein [Mammaliicoccus vitulinus]